MTSRKLLQQTFSLTLIVLLLAGCGGAPAEPTATPTLTNTPTLIPTSTSTPTNTPTLTPTSIPTITPTPTPPPINTVEAYHAAWNEALDLEPEVAFSITATDAAIEAAMYYALEARNQIEDIENLDVTISSGQIILAYVGGYEGQDRTGEFVAVSSVDEEGELELTVISGTVWMLVLQRLFDVLAGRLDDTEGQVDVTFTDIVVSEGELTISGFVTP